MRKIPLVLSLFLLLAGPALRAGQDPVRQGLRLLREGKAAKAYPLLEEGVAALRKEGKEPPPELLYDLGLAALRSGKEQEAKAAFLEALVGSGGKRPDLEAFSGWGLGAALWKAAGKAEKAGPAGLDQALKLVEEARDAWIRALLRNPSLAPLRRNIERANRKIEELKKRKKEQEKKNQKKKEEEKKQNQEKKNKEKEKNQSGRKKQKEGNRKKQNRNQRRKKEEKKPQEDRRRKQGGKQEKKKSSASKKKKLSGKVRRKLAMSPEQVKKLMDILKEMEKERARLEKARVPAPAKGGKGW